MAMMKGRREMTSIYLRPGVLDALRTLSQRNDVPMAHLLREAVDDLLSKHGVPAPKVAAKTAGKHK
jgi:Ribbon-helix-helix domain